MKNIFLEMFIWGGNKMKQRNGYIFFPTKNEEKKIRGLRHYFGFRKEYSLFMFLVNNMWKMTKGKG